MTKRIAWSKDALADIYRIEAYLAERSMTAAGNVLAAIGYSTSLLAEFPELGVRNRHGAGRLLIEPHYRYVIAYQVTDVIEIRYVFHPSQDR